MHTLLEGSGEYSYVPSSFETSRSYSFLLVSSSFLLQLWPLCFLMWVLCKTNLKNLFLEPPVTNGLSPLKWAQVKKVRATLVLSNRSSQGGCSSFIMAYSHLSCSGQKSMNMFLFWPVCASYQRVATLKGNNDECDNQESNTDEDLWAMRTDVLAFGWQKKICLVFGNYFNSINIRDREGTWWLLCLFS